MPTSQLPATMYRHGDAGPGMQRTSAFLGVVFVAALSATPAQACTPALVTAESVAKVLAGADDAFRGTVAGVDAGAGVATGRVRFAVDRVYKGAPPAGEWYLYLKFNSASCEGWTPDIGQRAIFFVYRRQAEIWAAPFHGLYDNQEIMKEALRRVGDKR